MTNHPRRATLRTASGVQIEHAGQKTVEYENGDGATVNVNFEVADVTRLLVAVGELQRRGMTVVGPQGSFVTGGQVTRPPGGNLDLEHSNGAYWMRLRIGENGTRLVAPIDSGEAVPTPQNLSECEGGRRSQRAYGGVNFKGAWRCRASKARTDAHAVQKLVGWPKPGPLPPGLWPELKP